MKVQSCFVSDKFLHHGVELVIRISTAADAKLLVSSVNAEMYAKTIKAKINDMTKMTLMGARR